MIARKLAALACYRTQPAVEVNPADDRLLDARSWAEPFTVLWAARVL
ncbi:MAG: hypothetical protein L0Y54_24100 [Sporichthyaceae bacterium]|nr:hypothetical protein [Sporichthyaceae bacterium]